MFIFSNTNINIATSDDATALTGLLNSAYRGESSKLGWTTEAHLIAGKVRTDKYNLQQIIKQSGSVVLKYSNQQHQVIGCVNLQQHGSRVYLGMFSVSPQLQGKGIGKEILLAAEEYAKYVQCRSIYMSVISVRTELIDWYQRRGFHDTGERIPFKEDGLTGKHLQTLEFMVMEKIIYNI
jgi:ribosomal protein S18 acetylase RimI-like enzyme